MPHGYGFFTFGWIQAEREIAREEKFGERYDRLTSIHSMLCSGLLKVCREESDSISVKDLEKLLDLANEMAEWQRAIADSYDNARQNHLTRYSTAIKKTAMQALKLCDKYRLLKDLETFRYSPEVKAIFVNEKEWAYLG